MYLSGNPRVLEYNKQPLYRTSHCHYQIEATSYHDQWVWTESMLLGLTSMSSLDESMIHYYQQDPSADCVHAIYFCVPSFRHAYQLSFSG